MTELWIWVRLPLRALDRAIDALKERVARGHVEGRRTEADADDAAAETIKRAVRDEIGPPPRD